MKDGSPVEVVRKLPPVCVEDFQLLELTETLPVSDAFRLGAFSSLVIDISAPTPTRMSAAMWHDLRQGKAVKYYAMLQLQRVNEQFDPISGTNPGGVRRRPTSVSALNLINTLPDLPHPQMRAFDRIAKIFDINISYCLSQGEISPTSVDLGKIGYISNWKCATCDFEIFNRSQIPLHIKFDEHLAKCITIEVLTLPSEGSGGFKTYTEKRVVDSASTDTADTSGPRNSGATIFVIHPDQHADFRATINPKLLDSSDGGPCTLEVLIVNLHNALDPLRLLVQFSLSKFDIIFQNLRSNGCLVLPTIEYPSNSKPVEELLSLRRRPASDSERDVHFALSVEALKPYSRFMGFQVLSRASATSVSQFEIHEGQKLDLRVQCVLHGNIQRVSTPAFNSFMTLREDGFVQVAVLSIRMILDSDKQVMLPLETIPVLTKFVEGTILSVFPKRILIRTMDDGDSDSQSDTDLSGLSKLPDRSQKAVRHSFTVRNLSPIFPLRYIVAIQTRKNEVLDHEDFLRILPNTGLVLPSEEQVVSVLLEPDRTRQFSAVQIVVKDMQSSDSLAQLILVDVVSSRISNTTSAPSAAELRASIPAGLTTEGRCLSLSGCTEIACQVNGRTLFCHEIDCGQQPQNSVPVKWDLTLSNKVARSIRFRLHVPASSSDWLQVSPSSGVVPSATAEGPGFIPLALRMVATRLGPFVAHVRIENEDNSTDCQFVRIRMEGVTTFAESKGQLEVSERADSDLFSIIIPGIHVDQNNLVLEMGELLFDAVSSESSIVLRNSANIPLEFLLRCETEQGDWSEVNFSLNRHTPAMLCDAVALDSGESLRIYLHILPRPANSANTVESKCFSVNVSCRQVRNYQKTIVVNALCFQPQLVLDRRSVFFRISPEHLLVNTVSSKPHAVDEEGNQVLPDLLTAISPAEEFVTLDLRAPIRYKIFGDLRLFSVEDNVDEPLTEPTGTVRLRIRPGSTQPSMAAITKELQRTRYLQEHFTIYNADRISEHYHIIVNLGVGHLSAFHAPLDGKFNAPVNTLEARICDVIRQFRIHCVPLYTTRAASSRRDSVPGLTVAVTGPPELVEDHSSMTEEERRIFTEYVYLVDQFVFYGLGRRSSHRTALSLANLLFETLLCEPVFAEWGCRGLGQTLSGYRVAATRLWPPHLARWLERLHHFVSIFTPTGQLFNDLHTLAQRLIASPS
eukprot:m.25453 g.25453  ORF g.25453 m.25453 type:complete len:1193 (-) comp37363_c0_seq1:25-3603(-)